MLKNKKAVLADLEKFVIGAVILGVVLAVGLLVLSQTKTQVATQTGVYVNNCSGITSTIQDSMACNATRDSVLAITGIPTWLPIIVIVFIGSILIFLIMQFRKQS